MLNKCIHSDNIMTIIRMLLLAELVSGLAIPAGKTSPGSSVNTHYGRVQGFVVLLSSPLAPVELFLGIPYATPPSGVNRFSPTRNPAPWSGVRMADAYGPSCPQHFPQVANETVALKVMSKTRREYLLSIEPLLRNQSEDCLHLNIYAPFQGRPAKSPNLLPVLVFIHGESFDWGSSHLYDGSILASYTNMFVVTLNFRLGVLGFLNIGRWPKGKTRLANFGLMDQVAALHWIQENIAEFGGDPKRVTLVGYGAGAACVHYLMTSPAVVPGLFQRGILMSGSAMAPWALVNDANNMAFQVAKSNDCVSETSEGSDSEEILNCLRDKPLNKILSAASRVQPSDVRSFRPIFGPSVDGVVIREHSGSGPHKRSDERPTYDILFGVSGLESAHHLSEAAIYHGLDAVERDILLQTFVAETYHFHQTEIFLTLINEYTDWERTFQLPLSVRDSTIEALSDGQFVAPAISLGDSLASPDKAAYFYVIDPNVIQKPLGFHGAEISLFFGVPLLSGSSQHARNYSKQDIMFSEAMILLFANFARNGNPNSPQDLNFRISKERNRFKGVFWEKYDKNQRKYLDFGGKPKMRMQFRAHRMAVLLQLLPELQRTGQHDVLQGHGILSVGDKAATLPGWINGSYVDVTKQREPTPTVACTIPAPSHTPTASPSTSNASTSSNTSSLATGNQQESMVYSTALSVTIAIGCSLLILNVLTFAGLYYRRDRRQQFKASGLQHSLSDASHASHINGPQSQSRPMLEETETIYLQTPSCNGTLMKGTLSRQRCCDYVAPLQHGAADRSVLDVRYDPISAIPPDKNFL